MTTSPASSRPTAAGVLYALSALAFAAAAALVLLVAVVLQGPDRDGVFLGLVFGGPLAVVGVLWLPLLLASAGGAVHARRSVRARRFALAVSSVSALLFVLAGAAGAYYFGDSGSLFVGLLLAVPFVGTGVLSLSARPSA